MDEEAAHTSRILSGMTSQQSKQKAADNLKHLVKKDTAEQTKKKAAEKDHEEEEEEEEDDEIDQDHLTTDQDTDIMSPNSTSTDQDSEVKLDASCSTRTLETNTAPPTGGRLTELQKLLASQQLMNFGGGNDSDRSLPEVRSRKQTQINPLDQQAITQKAQYDAAVRKKRISKTKEVTKAKKEEEQAKKKEELQLSAINYPTNVRKIEQVGIVSQVLITYTNDELMVFLTPVRPSHLPVPNPLLNKEEPIIARRYSIVEPLTNEQEKEFNIKYKSTVETKPEEIVIRHKNTENVVREADSLLQSRSTASSSTSSTSPSPLPLPPPSIPFVLPSSSSSSSPVSPSPSLSSSSSNSHNPPSSPLSWTGGTSQNLADTEPRNNSNTELDALIEIGQTTLQRWASKPDAMDAATNTGHVSSSSSSSSSDLLHHSDPKREVGIESNELLSTSTPSSSSSSSSSLQNADSKTEIEIESNELLAVSDTKVHVPSKGKKVRRRNRTNNTNNTNNNNNNNNNNESKSSSTSSSSSENTGNDSDTDNNVEDRSNKQKQLRTKSGVNATQRLAMKEKYKQKQQLIFKDAKGNQIVHTYHGTEKM